jgi:hypothetical protein
MKIYVVTQGDYSDYHICGAFTDKDVAQKCVDCINTNCKYECDFANIEEYDDNAWSEVLKVGVPYRVIRYENGCIICYMQEGNIEDCYNERNLVIQSDLGTLSTFVLAKDKDHAIKIASDLFAKYMAEKEGM